MTHRARAVCENMLGALFGAGDFWLKPTVFRIPLQSPANCIKRTAALLRQTSGSPSETVEQQD